MLHYLGWNKLGYGFFGTHRYGTLASLLAVDCEFRCCISPCFDMSTHDSNHPNVSLLFEHPRFHERFDPGNMEWQAVFHCVQWGQVNNPPPTSLTSKPRAYKSSGLDRSFPNQLGERAQNNHKTKRKGDCQPVLLVILTGRYSRSPIVPLDRSLKLWARTHFVCSIGQKCIQRHTGSRGQIV